MKLTSLQHPFFLSNSVAYFQEFVIIMSHSIFSGCCSVTNDVVHLILYPGKNKQIISYWIFYKNVQGYLRFAYILPSIGHILFVCPWDLRVQRGNTKKKELIFKEKHLFFVGWRRTFDLIWFLPRCIFTSKQRRWIFNSILYNFRPVQFNWDEMSWGFLLLLF